MRGTHTVVDELRRRVFTEIAKMAYEGGDYPIRLFPVRPPITGRILFWSGLWSANVCVWPWACPCVI